MECPPVDNGKTLPGLVQQLLKSGIIPQRKWSKNYRKCVPHNVITRAGHHWLNKNKKLVWCVHFETMARHYKDFAWQ